MDDERRAAILLNLARGGSPAVTSLSMELILDGGRDALVTAGLRASTAEHLVALRVAGAERREQDSVARLGGRIVTAAEGTLPPPLAGHPNAPPVLYLRGRVPAPAPRAALVGSRAAASTQLSFARRLGVACAESGVVVVSGLARGIDAAAHEGCLSGGGLPIGVLGTGIDRAYPRETRSLHERVRDQGLIVSMFPLGAPPTAHHFPARNRIVAALAQVVVVVAATEDSGSISTARAALDAGSEVAAVPGHPYDPLARGTNRLIRDGARPVLEAADLLDPLLGVGRVEAESFRHDRAEAVPRDPILRELSVLARTPDELAAALKRPVAEVVARLVELEVEGRVERAPGRRYSQRVK